MQETTKNPSVLGRIVIASLLLAACDICISGDDDGSVATQFSGCTDTDQIECSLNALGVDTTTSPRLDDDKDPLPADYAPLGSTKTINKFDEIFALNLRVTQTNTIASVNEVYPVTDNTLRDDILWNPEEGQLPWSGSSHARAGARADVDDDGREELLVVYRDTSRIDNPVYLQVIDDIQGAFAAASPRLISNMPATDLIVRTGDFDGDGDFEAAVGLMAPSETSESMGEVGLILLDNENGILGVTGNSKRFPLQVYKQWGQIVVETGNLDYDLPHEIGVVINEYNNSWGLATRGVSRYYVYDDATTGFAVLRNGNVAVQTPFGTYGTQVGEMAIGDVDGDNVDELVIGGLTDVGQECGLSEPAYVVAAFDDAKRGFAPLRATRIDYKFVSGACSSGSNRRLTYLHLNTADIDGDGAKEIQANEYILDDLRQDENTTAWRIIHSIPASQLLYPAQNGRSGSGSFNWATSSMAAGDVNRDEREDIVYYSQSAWSDPAIKVWGLDQIRGWSNLYRIPAISSNSLNSADRPEIILANVNDDSLALKYSDASYRLIFTEPIVIAALAAAPCSLAFGQNLDDCRTSFGLGNSTTITDETGWSVTVGASAGFEVEFSFLGVEVGGFEALVSVQDTYRKFTSRAYTLTKRVVYTTGPIEDSVVFTTVPLDVYTYTVLSHPNPDLVGSEIQVRLPREPITIMVDRDFYNAHVDGGAFQIDERVFTHTEGDVFSYPTPSERDRLISGFDNLLSREIDVGQGTGKLTTEINVYKEVSDGRSYSSEVALDIRATAGGVVAAVSIGEGKDAMISYGRGSESIYQGSVAQLPADSFPANAYRVGLFTYVWASPNVGQKFEVVNYWVRPQI